MWYIYKEIGVERRPRRWRDRFKEAATTILQVLIMALVFSFVVVGVLIVSAFLLVLSLVAVLLQFFERKRSSGRPGKYYNTGDVIDAEYEVISKKNE